MDEFQQVSNFLEHVKWIASLGVGGAMAVVIFIFYRKDMREQARVAKEERNVMLETVKANTEALATMRHSMEQNNRVLDTLAGTCMAVNRIAVLEHRQVTHVPKETPPAVQGP